MKRWFALCCHSSWGGRGSSDFGNWQKLLRSHLIPEETGIGPHDAFSIALFVLASSVHAGRLGLLLHVM